MKDESGMWLSRLELLAFGKFTDARLTLGPGFHIVYGPNEAGKSTTLRAIRQLLFGFDERTADNFVHVNPNLRIGGGICSEAGVELNVIRRKTRKDSLRTSGDDAVIDPERWREVLCGVDEATFHQRYGIDYAQLVDGGRQIATGNGDLGEILFATGSGIMDLTAVKRRLTDEAAEIFLPKGKKQRLNVALVQWQQQREQVVASQLPVAEWEETDRIRQETRLQLEEISMRWMQHIADRDRHRHWQQALSLVHEQDSLKQKLAALSAVPKLPDDFGSRRQEALVLLKHAHQQMMSASGILERADNQLSRLAIPEGLLARADELTKLVTEWGSYCKAQLDRPKLVEQYDRSRAASERLLETLGLRSQILSVGGALLDRARWAKVGQLGRQQAGLAQASNQAESRCERLRVQIEEIQVRLAGLPATQSLDELSDVVRNARSDGDLESQWTRAKDEHSSLEQEAVDLLARLGLWTGSLADLKSMRIPPPQVIKQFEAEFEANHARQSVLRYRATELDAELRQQDQQIQISRDELQVPSEADLVIAREKRDTIWQEIRENVAVSVVPAQTRADSFERAMREADVFVDRLRNEADRVAQLSEQLADRSENESRQHETMVQLAELAAAGIALDGRWSAEWPDLEGLPLAPREMQTWLARRETLLQNDALAGRRAIEVRALVERIEAHASAISRLLGGTASTLSVCEPSTNSTHAADPEADAGVHGASPSPQQLSFGWEQERVQDSNNPVEADRPPCTPITLAERLAHAEDRLARNDSIQQSRMQADETLVRLLREERETLEQSQLAVERLAAWQTTWRASMQELNLAPDSSPDVAAAYVETLYELADHQRQAEQLGERISGIEADALRFETSVTSLSLEIAPDLAGLTTTDVINTLRTRLSSAQRDQVTHKEESARKEHADRQLALARESRVRGDELLTGLCQIAGICPPNGDSAGASLEDSLARTFQDLEAIEAQSRSRDQFEEKLARVTVQLVELAGGESAEKFIDNVRQQSPDVLALRLIDLEAEANRVGAERDRLNQQLGGFDLKLGEMGRSAAAAEAEEKLRQSLAQIRSDAEQYVRIKVASTVLQSAIERYREKTRGPVLGIASELFREVTLNSFEGLRVDEDDQSKPILVGLRDGGRQAIAVSGMSEGTCDQLYLALRLASLQMETAPRCHLPFIVDDILIQFDDARAAAALRLLSRLGRQRQVIFFTHHEHLLEVAKTHLAGEYTARRLSD
jgi:uncharacterized protein YhaN